MDTLADIARDIRAALPSDNQRAELDARLAADDADALWEMAWQCPDGPALALRVVDANHALRDLAKRGEISR